jgi:hypothetical protein
MTGSERGATLRALAAGVQASRLERFAGFPMSTPDRPGHDVLETAENRAAVAVVLAEPEAVARLDVGAAPRAAAIFWSR